MKSGEGDLIDAMEPEEYVIEVEAGQSNQLHVWLSVHGFNVVVSGSCCCKTPIALSH